MDDVLTGLAEHLLLCIAEELAQCAIDLEEPAVKRDERHANWSVVEGTTESLFAILQCRHSCVPLRDVPNCRDHCHPLAVADEEVSAGLDNPLITVGMLNPGLVARRRVRGGKDGPVLRLRRSPRRLRKDDGEAAANDLLRDEPIERAVSGIDGQYDPLRIGERHRLRGRLPDGPEALLTLAQRRFGSFARRDVYKNSLPVEGTSLRIAHKHCLIPQPDPAIISCLHWVLNIKDTRSAPCPLHRSANALAVLRMGPTSEKAGLPRQDFGR